ncbi:S8 family serine peptidase [Muricoccus nepalensis]|nr:S8 family serine peptidase [Roseomonas nepalensis]
MATILLPAKYATTNPNLLGGLNGINAEGAWKLGYNGAGTRVAAVDDGFNYKNAALAKNYSTSLDYDALRRDSDAMAEGDDYHGTMVMGVIGASADSTRSVGVAYGSTLIGVRVGFGSLSSAAQFTDAMTYAWKNSDVVNMSWSYSAWGEKQTYTPVLAQGSATGRGGLGAVWVSSAGNNGGIGDDVNLHGVQSSVYVMTVGSTDRDGAGSSFSTHGVAVHVAAPGNGIVTTVDEGFGTGSGTSFSAPTVSALASLVLDANDHLGWRDVQEIIGMTAHKTSVTTGYLVNKAGDWNGGGMHHSSTFGFGIVDAGAAVRLAETWSDHGTTATMKVASANVAVNKAVGADFASSTTVADNLHLDKAQVTINFSGVDWGDYRISLVSAKGTESVLLDHAYTNSGANASGIFTTEQFWGEDSKGTWTLKLHDYATNDTLTLTSWSLSLYGDRAKADNQYVYTDELGAMAKADASRLVLGDANGGLDTVNFSAVTGKLNFSLADGGTLTGTDGAVTKLTLKAGTVLENLFGGAGDDILVGNAVNNYLRGGYGNDHLRGGAGIDIFIEGQNTGEDWIDDFTAGEKVWLTQGVSLASLNGRTAMLSDGGKIVSGTAYIWKTTDFVRVDDWLDRLPHSDVLIA